MKAVISPLEDQPPHRQHQRCSSQRDQNCTMLFFRIWLPRVCRPEKGNGGKPPNAVPRTAPVGNGPSPGWEVIRWMRWGPQGLFCAELLGCLGLSSAGSLQSGAVNRTWKGSCSSFIVGEEKPLCFINYMIWGISGGEEQPLFRAGWGY